MLFVFFNRELLQHIYNKAAIVKVYCRGYVDVGCKTVRFALEEEFFIIYA